MHVEESHVTRKAATYCKRHQEKKTTNGLCVFEDEQLLKGLPDERVDGCRWVHERERADMDLVPRTRLILFSNTRRFVDPQKARS